MKKDIVKVGQNMLEELGTSKQVVDLQSKIVRNIWLNTPGIVKNEVDSPKEPIPGEKAPSLGIMLSLRVSQYYVTCYNWHGHSQTSMYRPMTSVPADIITHVCQYEK